MKSNLLLRFAQAETNRWGIRRLCAVDSIGLYMIPVRNLVSSPVKI